MAAKKPAKKKDKSEWTISVIRAAALLLENAQADLPPGSYAIAGTLADSKGNVIFAEPEEVSQSRFEAGFSNCLALATSMIDRASALGRNLEVESITLKLSANAKYGCSLLADAKVAGAIELKIKRKPVARSS